MKNIFKLLALSACLACATTACVEENTSVSLNGVIDPSTDGCTSADGDLAYISALYYDSSIVTAYHGYVNVVNNMGTESVWSSSGGSSSSGSTFETDLPNVNTIFIDKVYIRCVSLDDDTDACSGKDMFKADLSSGPIAAGGSANIGFSISPKDFDWGSFTKATIKLSLHYHDSGVLNGRNYETSHVLLNIEDLAGAGVYDDFLSSCNGAKPKPLTSCSTWGQDAPSNGFECDEKSESKSDSGDDSGDKSDI